MLLKAIQQFVKLEAAGGGVLLIAALVAIILNNTPLHPYYQAFFEHPIFSKSLLLWINEGLMSFFFLLVSLEIKRELVIGDGNKFANSLLPAMAALGGMVMPAVIYIIFNQGDAAALRGWAIPTATDIAFSLAVLTSLGRQIPTALKLFLMTLAVFDDIGAIIIIALFYAENISGIMLVIAGGLAALLFVFNRCKVHLIFYWIVAIALWICILRAGIHPTVVGVILGLAVPVQSAQKIERQLHPWIAFGVLPLFAMANAGISFAGVTNSELFNSITWGIVLGLLIGKPLGIMMAVWLSVKTRLTVFSKDLSWRGIFGVALMAGIGFTMSLFIGTLAFGRLAERYLVMVRIAVMIGSILSALIGYWMLRFTHRHYAK